MSTEPETLTDFETRINEVSSAYLNAPHEPDNPAWLAFTRELEMEFKEMTERGIKVVLRDTLPPPDEFTFPEVYRRLFQDKTILVSLDQPSMERDHPLSTYSPFDAKHITKDGSALKFRLRYTEVFDALHTYFGHYRGYCGYSPEGRICAYRKHLERFMASNAYAAIPALFSETLGVWAASYTQNGTRGVRKARIIRASF